MRASPAGRHAGLERTSTAAIGYSSIARIVAAVHEAELAARTAGWRLRSIADAIDLTLRSSMWRLGFAPHLMPRTAFRPTGVVAPFPMPAEARPRSGGPFQEARSPRSVGKTLPLHFRPAPEPLLAPQPEPLRFPSNRVNRAPIPEERVRVERPARRRASRMRRILARTGLATAAAAAAAVTFPLVAPHSLTDRFVAQHEATRALSVTDVGGHWLGTLPRPLSSDQEETPYLALETEVPDEWWEITVALEDRNIGSWRTLHGIDVPSAVRAFAGLAHGTDGRGGSTLAMMLVRSMKQLDPSSGGHLDKIGRKVGELFHGALLYRRLGGFESDTFRQYVARHIPLVIGARGSRMGTSLYGIGMTSRVLWGRAPEDLELHESAILAAALYRPVVLAPEGDAHGMRVRDDRWALLVARAELGLRLAYGDTARTRAAIAKLRAMPAPRPHLDSQFERAASSESERFRMAANPETRMSALAGPETMALHGELLNRYGRTYRQKISAVRLTLDLAENHVFRGQVHEALQTAEASLGKALNGQLTARLGANTGIDVIVAVARGGQIVRYYGNSSDMLFNGAMGERDGDLVYDPQKSTRAIGSLGKAFLAVPFGTADTAERRYCNARLPGGTIRNANGDAGGPCGASGRWFTARDAYRRSLNLPLIWRARALPPEELQRLATRFRLRLPGDVSPAIALPLGMATARPADLLGLFTSIGRGADGQSATSSEPTLLHSYRVPGQQAWQKFPASAVTFDLVPEFKAGAGRFVADVLQAPLAPGGTLAPIGELGTGLRLHIAKSGTTDAAQEGASKDKYALGYLAGEGGEATYLVMISARDGRSGLGTGIGWSAFYPVVRSAANAAVHTAERQGN